MAAYLVVDIQRITDEQRYEQYKTKVSPDLLAAGGQYLARGGAIDVLEGDWHPSRLVIVRFESSASARRWWESQAYEPLKQMRQASTTTRMVLVEGVAEGDQR